ncbi:Sec-independent protein translocase subunit TatA [Streptomyces sp. NPDC057582]|uniref:Sec-independent protein translocase subunit TatA n=1 Tax=Streptomyces sp. NPDC057582 TaxID=3346174 RepID=UPI00367F227D
MFGKLGAPELLIILVVVFLLFGAKRLPDMARSLGQSMRILKSETKAMREREDGTTDADAFPAQAEAAGSTAFERTLHAVPAGQRTSVTATAHDVLDPH